MYDNVTDESSDEVGGWLEYEEIPVMSGKQRWTSLEQLALTCVTGH